MYFEEYFKMYFQIYFQCISKCISNSICQMYAHSTLQRIGWKSSNIQYMYNIHCILYSFDQTNILDQVKGCRPPYVLRLQQTLELTSKNTNKTNLIFAEFLLGLRRTMAQAVLIDVCSWKNLTHNIHTHISLQIWLNRKVCLGLRHGWQADLRLPMDQSLTKLYFLCMSQM